MSQTPQLFKIKHPDYNYMIACEIDEHTLFECATASMERVMRQNNLTPQPVLLVNTARDTAQPIWLNWNGDTIDPYGLCVTLAPKYQRRINKLIITNRKELGTYV